MNKKNPKNIAGLMISLGEGLLRARIHSGLTQAQLADQAGVSKRTVERLEAGRSVQSSGFFHILAVLNLLSILDPLTAETAPSPMVLLKAKGKNPRRVSTRSKKPKNSAGPWTWGEGT